jgi:holo-[acyl-carrier protein] synthase
MIIGLGNDLVDIRRIEKTIERFGDRFLAKVFTKVEREKADSRTESLRAATYAKRFAAKEAATKALGKQGLFWRDMEVVNGPDGRPVLTLSGSASRNLAALIPPGMVPRIHLTLSDAYPLAQAVVIIEALPA